MGYYDNPPIIQASRSGEIMGEALASFGKSIGDGITAYARNQRDAAEKERLTIDKLQKSKNAADLTWNEKTSQWSKEQTNVNTEVDAQIYGLVQQKITAAADAQAELETTVDPAKRQALLKTMRDAESFMNNATELKQAIAKESATWRLDTNAIKVGEVGGHVVNGATDEEIEANTGFLEIIGGMNGVYEDSKINVMQDTEGDGVVVTVSGKKNGKLFEKTINSKSYLRAKGETEDGMLMSVEGLTDYDVKSIESIVDKKGSIYESFLNNTRETVDVPSSGTSGGIGSDQYQLIGAQRIKGNEIKASIRQNADITASAMLATDSQVRLRTTLNYTLKKGVGYYDDVFKKIESPEEQKRVLAEILTEKSYKSITKDLKRTVDSNGVETFWANGELQLKEKPKPVKAVSGDLDGDGLKDPKPEKTTYLEEYYNNIVLGSGRNIGQARTPKSDYGSRVTLVENLNKLSGKTDKYVTREDLFKQFQQMPYIAGKVDTGMTYEEYFAKNPKKGNVKTMFNKYYPLKDKKGYVLVKGDGGVYKPVTDYDIETAEGRVKMALDQTSNETERKLLQSKIDEARLVDWMDKNPIKQGESQEAYANRAKKAGH
jgi:hypothetical protein